MDRMKEVIGNYAKDVYLANSISNKRMKREIREHLRQEFQEKLERLKQGEDMKVDNKKKV